MAKASVGATSFAMTGSGRLAGAIVAEDAGSANAAAVFISIEAFFHRCIKLLFYVTDI